MFSEANIIKQGNSLYVQHGDDSGLYVEFSLEPIQNEEKTIEAGHAVFEEKEYITIRIAGDTKTVRKRPVQLEWSGNTPPDQERWPRQYDAFKKQQKQVMEGMPLEQWPMMNKADVMMVKGLNIYTVEQLSGLGDNALTWLGARTWRDKAVAYLAEAEKGAGVAKLQSENDQLRIQMEALKNQMDALLEAKPELMEKKRGRPAKGVTNGSDLT